MPSPPQEYLTYQYGEDWHVPKKSFDSKEYLQSRILTTKIMLRFPNIIINKARTVKNKLNTIFGKDDVLRIELMSRVLCDNMVVIRVANNEVKTLSKIIRKLHYSNLAIHELTFTNLNDIKFDLIRLINSTKEATSILIELDLSGNEVELLGTLMKKFRCKEILNC